jgi:nitroreductase
MTSWTKGEITIVVSAVRRAPSVHNTQPWVVEFHDGFISLFERLDLTLHRHDPKGRDRLMSCGAALANLVLAVRILGWDARTSLFADPARPDEVARVAATGRRAPSDVDWERYSIIPWRRSHRGPFAAKPVPGELRRTLVTAATAGGVQLRPLGGLDESTAVAGLLDHSALLLRQDRGYQRELAAWTNTRPAHRPGGGVPAPTLTHDTLPWAGLVRPTTSLPDTTTLAARLDREYLLLVETPDDGPRDHMLAGRAVQDCWLAATAAGLAGSVLTQPLQVAETRAGLIERLGLAGFPQALLRFGYPAGTSPRSPRVPLAELIRPNPKESTP